MCFFFLFNFVVVSLVKKTNTGGCSVDEPSDKNAFCFSDLQLHDMLWRNSFAMPKTFSVMSEIYQKICLVRWKTAERMNREESEDVEVTGI